MKIHTITLTILALFCLSTTSLLSQDRVLLMSGKEIDCKIIEELEGDIVYEVTKKNGKKKVIQVNKSEIFSVSKNGQEPVVYYSFDEDLGDWMTEEEMYIYIVGEQDARNNFKAKGVEVLGYVVGAGFGYASQGSFIFILLGPTVYTAYQFIPMIRIKEEHLSDKTYAYNDFYLNGFEPVARTKRVLTALKSSFIGATVGTIIYYIFPFN